MNEFIEKINFYRMAVGYFEDRAALAVGDARRVYLDQAAFFRRRAFSFLRASA